MNNKNSKVVGLGAHPSKKDKRDIKDKKLALATPYPIAHRTDVSGMKNLLKERYQKLLGLCVACAITSYVEFLYWKKTGLYTKLSVAFCYNVIKRLIDKDTKEGTSLRSGLKAVYKYGICKEITMPTNYDLTHAQFINQNIPQEAWTEALNYTIGGYVSVPIERSLISAAIFKYGLTISRMECGSTWWIPSWLPKDIFPLKKPKQIVSGHAIDHDEYDLTLKDECPMGFLNWWSESWGNKGRGKHIYENYKPTEVWTMTLDSVQHMADSDTIISDSVWRKVLDIFRKVGNIMSGNK